MIQCRSRVVLLMCFANLLWEIKAFNILLFPFPWKSHIAQLATIGQALYNRGHELSIVLPPSYPDVASFENTFYDLIQYRIKDPDLYGMDRNRLETLNEEFISMSPLEEFRAHIDGFVQFCSNPLSDQELFRKLQKKQFDLAIVDAFVGSRCYLVLLHRLGIPYVSFSTQYEPWVLRNPSLPSFTPFFLAHDFTERMDFWERVQNFLTILDWTIFPGVKYIEDGFLSTYFYESSFVPLNQLARRSLLWLINTDALIDYPRPSMPNEVHIGGLSTAPSKPLTHDLQEFLDSATEGAILVSFGSTLTISHQYSDKLLETFQRIKYHVIWKYTGQEHPTGVQGRIRLMDWLPQNDILGHPNVKLFITHCGANSQYEALYHAVPMIGFPIFSEQPHNAQRMAYHGYGIHMDIAAFEPEELTKAIDHVIHNETYYQNIKRASEIFLSRPMKPAERSVYWVNHVLRFGGKHLRSYALNLEWYEYLMLDILAPGLAVIFVCGIGCGSCVYFLCHFFESGKQKVE